MKGFGDKLSGKIIHSFAFRAANLAEPEWNYRLH